MNIYLLKEFERERNRLCRRRKDQDDRESRTAKIELLKLCGYTITILKNRKKSGKTCDIEYIKNKEGEILASYYEIETKLLEYKENKTDEYFNNCKLLQSNKVQHFKKLIGYYMDNLMSDILEEEGFEIEEKKIRQNTIYSSFNSFVTKSIRFNNKILFMKGEPFNKDVSRIINECIV